MDRFLITGTGRCGTGYISHLLTNMGIKTTHEGIFTILNTNITRTIDKDWMEKGWPLESPGESSWMAIYFLDQLMEQGVKIIHLIRDPIEVIRSFMRIKFFEGDNVYRIWSERQNGYPYDCLVGTRLEKIINRIIYFHDRLEKRQDFWLKIEDINTETLKPFTEFLGCSFTNDYIEKAIKKTTFYNSVGDKKDDFLINWNTLPAGETTDRLYEIAKKYDYV